MPSTSKKQARFMVAVAHGFRPKNAKAPTIAVAKEFLKADMAKKARKLTIAEVA